MVKTDTVLTHSAPAPRKRAVSWMAWDAITEPGAYVERQSGVLGRFAKEALAPGARPAILKESRDASPLVKLSEDPFISTFEARLRSAQFNIAPNF